MTDSVSVDLYGKANGIIVCLFNAALAISYALIGEIFTPSFHTKNLPQVDTMANWMPILKRQATVSVDRKGSPS